MIKEKLQVNSELNRTESNKFVGDDYLSNYIKDPEKNEKVDLDLMIYSIKRKGERKKMLIELIIYIPFIIAIICWLFYGTDITGSFAVANSLSSMFRDDKAGNEPVYNLLVGKNFLDIKNNNDFYMWIELVFVPDMFTNTHYNGKDRPINFYRYSTIANKLIGGLRIRQLRVNLYSCDTLLKFAPRPDLFDQKCYYDLGNSVPFLYLPFVTYESWDTFGCDISNSSLPSWSYLPLNQRRGLFYFGEFMTLSNGGFAEFIDFNKTQDEALNVFKKLRYNCFIDKQTRAIILEWFYYNSNVNYFAKCKMAVEITAGGAYLPSLNFQTFKLTRLRMPIDYIFFIISMISPFYVIYLFVSDIYYLCKSTCKKKLLTYLKNPWFYIDMIICGLFAFSFVLRIIIFAFSFVPIDLEKLEYPFFLEDMQDVCWADDSICGVLIVIVIFRACKYFQLNDYLNLLSKTLMSACTGIFLVSLTFFIVLTAFAIAGYAMFGDCMEKHSTVLLSYISLLNILAGSFSYGDMQIENTVLLPYFYVAFIFLAFFVIYNMFISVLNDAFEDASSEVLDVGFPSLINFNRLKRNIKEIFKNGEKDSEFEVEKKKVIDVSKLFNQGDDEIVERLKIYQENKEGKSLTIDDLRSALGSKASEEMCKRIMSRFDADNSNSIEIEELEKMKNKKKIHLEDFASKVESKEDFFKKNMEKVEELEKNDPPMFFRLNELEEKIELLLDEIQNNI